MAFQTLIGGMPFPNWPIALTAVPDLGTNTIIATNRLAHIFAATKASSPIRKFHFRTGTVTTGDTIDARIETVDNAANGDPTGTLWATDTNCSIVVASSDDNVWKVGTLTADATVAIGDVIAMVIVNGAVGNMAIANYPDNRPLFPYTDLFTASWAKSVNSPLIIPEYADGSFAPIRGYSDTGAITTTTFNSGSTTNRRGNRFVLPFPTKTSACWVWVDADGDFTVKIYDGDGTTVLATTASINNFQRQTTTGGVQCYPFTSTATLLAGVTYRVVVEPSSVTNLSTYELDVPVAGVLDMFPGGQACHASVFTSSAWVETTTKRNYLGIYLDGFDDAVSAGGGLRLAGHGGLAS